MKVIAAFERFGRIVMVFEDGSMGKVVGFKRLHESKKSAPGEPVLLMRPPLAMVGEVPEGFRVSQMSPHLWPDGENDGKAKSSLDVEGDD
jgi:hypothetical protein